MKNYDIKHIAFHVLVALYFIWLPVFGVLLYLALNDTLNTANVSLSKIFLTWIFLNLIMGSALFFVIQLFQKKNLVNKIIRVSYITMTVLAITITTVIVLSI